MLKDVKLLLYQRVVESLRRRVVCPDILIEEAVSRAWLIWEEEVRAGHINDKGQKYFWLVKTALRQLLAELKRSRRLKTALASDAFAEMPMINLHKADIETLFEAAGLSVKEKQIVKQHTLQQLTFGEISLLDATSDTTLRQRFHRSMQKLHTEGAKEEGRAKS